MQGSLNEIDLRSILQLISLGQKTGTLSICSYQHQALEYSNYFTNADSFFCASHLDRSKSSELFWFLFFVSGQIVYAYNERNSNLFRLQDYLYRYKIEATTDKFAGLQNNCSSPLEYAYLWFLLEERKLTPAQARTILQNLVQETLFDLFNLYRGNFIFKNNLPLAPQPLALEFPSPGETTSKQIQQWQQLLPHIYSPNQRPTIVDRNSLQQNLPENACASLSRWSDGQKNLRQLSRYLNRDILTTAKAIYPLVKKGWMKLLEPLANENFDFVEESSLTDKERVTHFVYIGNDANLGQSLEKLGSENGCRGTIVANPLQALGQILEIWPDSIFCESNLPQLDSYAICTMLRNCPTLKDVPIILLANEEKFIDRLKAQMVGATEYLVKPLTDPELSSLVKRYLVKSNKNGTSKRILCQTLLSK
jgi:twitching motility two-component system response regulator PilG